MTAFETLASVMQTQVRKDARHNTDPDWTVTGKSFDVPVDIVAKIVKGLGNKAKMDKIRAGKPTLYKDLAAFGNLVAAFGQFSPTARVNNGLLDMLYLPSIYLANDVAVSKISSHFGFDESEIKALDTKLVLACGNAVIPLYFDDEDEKWKSEEIQGTSSFTIRFGTEMIPTKTGKLEVIKVSCYLKGVEKPSTTFYAKVGTIRDQATGHDAYEAAEIIEQLLTYGPDFMDRLSPMIKPLPSGGVWVDTFANERFPYGMYPVVSLREEQRQDGDRAWTNYIVRCVTGEGELDIRLPSKDQALFTLLGNYYAIESEDGSVEEMDIGDFFGDEGGDDKFAIAYFNKATEKKKINGELRDIEVVNLKVEPYASDEFRALTPVEVYSFKKDAGIKVDPSEVPAGAAEAALAAKMKANQAATTEEDENFDPFNGATAPASVKPTLGRTAATNTPTVPDVAADAADNAADEAYSAMPEEEAPAPTTKKRSRLGASSSGESVDTSNGAADAINAGAAAALATGDPVMAAVAAANA